MKPVYNENMVPADLELPIDGTFAKKLARYWWFTADGQVKAALPPPMLGVVHMPPLDPFTLDACEVTIHGRQNTLSLMEHYPQVAANVYCPCGQCFIVSIRRIKFGGVYTHTGHRGYILFGIAITWCKCGRLLWATLGDTSWARAMQDLFPTHALENEDDDDDNRFDATTDPNTSTHPW